MFLRVVSETWTAGPCADSAGQCCRSRAFRPARATLLPVEWAASIGVRTLWDTEGRRGEPKVKLGVKFWPGAPGRAPQLVDGECGRRVARRGSAAVGGGPVEVQLAGADDGLRPALHAEFGVKIVEMFLDRAHGDDEPLRDGVI